MDTCPNCGGRLLGDGYRTVRHCEFSSDVFEIEPDAAPVLCVPEPAQQFHTVTGRDFGRSISWAKKQPRLRDLLPVVAAATNGEKKL